MNHRRRPATLVFSMVALGSMSVAVLPSAPAAAVVVAAAPAGGNSSGRLEVSSVSNPRPQLVSGDEALLRVAVPASIAPAQVQITANGRDVTSAFSRQPGRTLLGLVMGLRRGDNSIVASAAGVAPGTLTVTDHSINGPVFSGRQQLPFICQTQAFGLGPAVPPSCAAPTQVTYLYRTTGGIFKPLPDPSTRPANLAVATVNGRQVPYIVRLEQGTIDRAVYQIAVLYDGSAPTPVRRDDSWNGKLVYTFGGGCDAGFHQGTATGGVVDDEFLSQGYGVVSSTLNVLNNNCSIVISAEAAMMVKEHFIDTYGPIQHTIGWGGSGGAIQQYDIADAYPGILDGIIPGVSFTDAISTSGPVTDCRLLDTYFAATSVAFTTAQMTTISGYGDYTTCQSWDATFANRVTATGSCDPSIPADLLYDPVTNPDGVKCSIAEQLVNQLGRNPNTELARSPLDNVGIQYGLQALDSGVITPAQFADLNASIGGYDAEGNVVAQRTQADPLALKAVYRDGLLLNGGQGLMTTPVIDQRTYLDLVGFGADIHTTHNSFIIRARLLQATGTDANQVIIENAPTLREQNAANAYELDAMDRWLTAIDGDRSHLPMSTKIALDKPGDLGDGCFLPSGRRILETLSYQGTGKCATLYPVFSDPRLVAGQPLVENVEKCRLQPLNFSDYPVVFTAPEQAQLRATFPSGVCDYGLDGVGQQAPLGTWLVYGNGSKS